MTCRSFAFFLTNVHCIDETEHEGIFPAVGEGIANDAMRLTFLLLSEDSNAQFIEHRSQMFNLGSNYEDGTSIDMNLRLGSIQVFDTQPFPVAIDATLFLVEEDYFGDITGIEAAIRGYAEAAKVTHGLLSTIIGLFPGVTAKIASGIGKIAAVVEPLIANLILSGGNDLFSPQDVSLLIPAAETPLEPADRSGTIDFTDHGGHYRLTYRWDVLEHQWSRIIGTARDIGIGADGSVYVIGTDQDVPSGNGRIYKWDGRNWDRIGGYGSRIAVDPQGRWWIVNSNQEIWGPSGRLPGSARDIGIGADGSVYVIGTDSPTQDDGNIYRWYTSRWGRVEGYGVSISVAPDGNPWVVRSNGEIYRLS